MDVRAAVMMAPGGGVEVRTVQLDPPKAQEVLVRLRASGVCHTDLSVLDGTFPFMGPMVLGHEGAGVVEAVGPGVTRVAPGDHVILSWAPFCGECYFCIEGQYAQCAGLSKRAGGGLLDGTKRFHADGEGVGSFAAVASLSEYTVVPERGAIRIDPEIPLDRAALLGCGVQTGVGAAITSAAVRAGTTCAVWGAGGIGLNVIQGCVLAGARQVIAVDTSPFKLGLAREFGATDTVDASNGDPVQAVMALTGGIGADYTFEAIGRPATMEQAYHAARPGGTCTIVGVGKFTESFSLPAGLFAITEKVLRGSFYGGGATPRDFPRLLEWYRQGRLKLDALITTTYTLDGVAQAFVDLEAGKNARGVVIFD
jgi:S-(hydroxymethyl)glutathione dehydrogenase/alcohol dehydrogenase